MLLHLDENVEYIVSFLSPSDLRILPCVSRKHVVTVKSSVTELCKCYDPDILQSIIQNGSGDISLYGKVLQGPYQPKFFTPIVSREVIYSSLQGAVNSLCFTLGGF